MENNKFYLEGFIQGKPKDVALLQNYMQTTMNTIKSQIKSKFSKDKESLYIYYKYDSKKIIFKIFVVIFLKYNYNYQTDEITYLITLGEDYPKNPPKVFCLTDFHEKIDIFDVIRALNIAEDK